MNTDVKAASIKMFWAWLGVGLSAMTPLQWVQLIAGIAATVFSVVQTWKLLRGSGK
jgi:hypothetical protein